MLTVKLEAAVGAFNADRLTNLRPCRDVLRERAERLDEERQVPVAAIGAGDGEGMCAFQAIEGDEGELPRPVTFPLVIQFAGDFSDIAFASDGNEGAVHLAATPDPSGK